jgi:hypothetical protein
MVLFPDQGRELMARKAKKRRYSRSAGSDVEREMRRYKKGTARSGPGGRGGRVKSRKQAIAIGLSKARRAGVDLPPPEPGKTSKATRQRAKTDRARGRSGATRRPSPRRARGSLRALKHEGRTAASHKSLSGQAKSAAARRSPAERSAASRKAVRTKGPARRKAAAKKAARTRAANAG